MLKRRNTEGFNLSFLDVMSCGLGAVILLFMLVKFNVKPPQLSVETPRLKKEIQQLTLKQRKIESTIKTTSQKMDDLKKALTEKKRLMQLLLKQSNDTSKNNAAKSKALAVLEKSIVVDAPMQAEDVVELAGKGEETYLLGLNVEGSSIGILLDNSASMTEEKLVDVIRRKFDSDAQKRSAPKWSRTIRVARWLLARVPQSSKLTMVSFNKDAHVVGPNKIINASDRQKILQLSTALDKLIPEEGTNLQSAINKMVAVNPHLTNLYLITDGLPTLGEKGGGLGAFTKCGSFFGKATTISGECREILFYQSVKNANLAGVKVNIILLPLEGDPSAPKAYWNWASNTGGLLLSPADSWP